MVRVPIATALAAVLVCPFPGAGLQAAAIGPEDPRLEFEVASLKPHPPDSGGIDVPDLPTGQVTFTNFLLRLLVPKQPDACFASSRLGESLIAGALLSGAATAQAPLEFEVASIKRNMTNTFATGPSPSPASGQVSMTNVPVQAIVLRGYPLETAPVQVIGLPDWAESERYDVVAKGKRGASQDEQQQMWRALLNERLKLQAHYETRERPGYNLVFARADKRPGPQLTPSTLDCSQPPAPLNLAGASDQKSVEAMAMARCSVLMMMSATTQAAYTGGTTMAALVRTMSGFAGRPIVDHTGLQGYYAVKLTFAREGPMILPGGAAPPPPPTDEVPSIFTAVQEQLGLKLESTTVQGQVLVIDHIERPSDD